MAGTNDFQVFSAASNSNVLTQAAYLARTELQTGVSSGQASSALFNKSQRQSSIIASMIGQFIATQTGANAVDDGTTATLLNQFLSAIQYATRVKFTANISFYVNPSSGSDNNNGLTSAAPFQTLQGAVNAIYQKYDFNNFTATINLTNATYASPASGQSVLNISGRPVGASTFCPILVVGNPASPSSVVLNGVNNSAVVAQQGAAIAFSGVTFSSTGVGLTGSGIAVISKGTAFLNGPCAFGACGGSHIQCYGFGEFITLAANYSIVGNSPIHFYILEQGRISIGSSTITLTGNPAFSTAFIDCETNATFVQLSSTFSGTGTGQRYRLIGGGTVEVGGSLTYFPGSVAGTVDAYSSYI